MKTFFATFGERLSAETPVFEARLRRIALRIGASAIAMLTLEHSMNLAGLPAMTDKVLGFVIMGCACIAGTASLATSDAPGK